MTFWCSQNENEKKRNWIRWKILLKNKGDGVWVLDSSIKNNKALLAKQTWKILKTLETMWVKFLTSIYFSNKSFLESKS